MRAATDALRAVGIEDPRLDAEILLAEATGLDRAALAAGAPIEPPAARRFGELVRRRLRREPVAYVVGRKGFRRLELAVDRRVLVPRPETELLVEVALDLRPARVLDVGTGSGAIALAVADELPAAEVVATDTSPGALEVARANAERLGLTDRVRFFAGTLPWAGVKRGPGAEPGDEAEPFDLVLANLPYVAERDWPSLQPEVTQWEPKEALLAGPDGLDAYRTLFAPRGCLFPGRPERGCLSFGIAEEKTTTRSGSGEKTTTVAVEVGEGQAPAVAELVRGAGWTRVETRRDLAGIERVVIGWGTGR
ncbi:MAG TPA: peptide chain release factor N(5)-glutamine methyltransferase [Solirubrobacterales bacterium]|nr:peptide chain release factor N(5)-glutamine methyltransferase [Solirubrobacterales bacterium]